MLITSDAILKTVQMSKTLTFWRNFNFKFWIFLLFWAQRVKASWRHMSIPVTLLLTSAFPILLQFPLAERRTVIWITSLRWRKALRWRIVKAADHWRPIAEILLRCLSYVRNIDQNTLKRKIPFMLIFKVG